MKYLVLVIYSLLLTTISTKITWEDLIQLDKGCYANYWYSKEAVDLELYATSSVNVRTRADSNSTKLGILKTGEPIKVTAITDNNWYEVLFNDKRGYIKCEYLTELQASMPIRYNDFIYYIGAGKETITGVAKYWSLVPDFVKSEFKADNSKLIVTDEHLGYRFYNDSELKVLGVTSFYPSRNNCELYISSDINSLYALVHEMGHYVDGKMEFISKSSDFQDIWNNEKSFISIFHSTNIENVSTTSEYFAESFNLFLTKPEDLNRYCPLTYNYIKKVLDDFKQKYSVIID